MSSNVSPTYPRNRKQFLNPASGLPKRIILVRHGESLGNADAGAYCSIPDWQIPLTPKGVEQSRALGVTLKEIIGESPLFIYCSPYMRARQTLKGMVESFETNHIVGAREEPRITEQQFGNFQNGEEMQTIFSDRSDFGRFYYRFPEGEAGLDVYNRATSFIATLFRDWTRNDPEVQKEMTVIVVTHGLTLRLFLMRWYQYTVREFEESVNPSNASYVLMERSTPEGESQSCQYSHFRVDSESLAMLNLADRTQSLESEVSTGRSRLSDIIGT
mmetsp:Transcript_28233/g.52599  ORF Transcript_28233/g.52599 Transcript_28233/m.52599 type:complete len:273 (+) Transcript_28233:126-944(+)|eukprot:CAMPEP_0114429856 /NCGR_PEP_ID=MMETSP0103-20121206/9717_1 /TAXON_ID=37642 ORGANISM="Paraphysomonas imperforata, Strain PA2" /NCGR_SAMPLE_ID=MMETSP0103 /ASSEMBLY_ACC=CAM_ASM_000201 /LENGTH=272 /DNA_ID=CAMNT_0001599237 /DNA_START=115 /DNA_END=933 /DNA_ORIENTATION=-